jgi:hypothetical protein
MTRILIPLFAFGVLMAVNPADAAAQETKIPKQTCVKPSQDCAKHCLEAMKVARDAKQENLARGFELCHHVCVANAIAVEFKNPAAWDACELCERVCNDVAAEVEKSTSEDIRKHAKALRDCAKACADARK